MKKGKWYSMWSHGRWGLLLNLSFPPRKPGSCSSLSLPSYEMGKQIRGIVHVGSQGTDVVSKMKA